MKAAVVVSLLVMFAILTFGKPANEDKHEAGAKIVTLYQKNLLSDSPNQKRACVYRHFCGYVVRCCQGRIADENESGSRGHSGFEIGIIFLESLLNIANQQVADFLSELPAYFLMRDTEELFLMSEGRVFQSVGAATEKDLAPYKSSSGRWLAGSHVISAGE
ncbi:uncharacterized protein LOC144629624 [Oculina patagonica]